jgi:hypothetical protein
MCCCRRGARHNCQCMCYCRHKPPRMRLDIRQNPRRRSTRPTSAENLLVSAGHLGPSRCQTSPRRRSLPHRSHSISANMVGSADLAAAGSYRIQLLHTVRVQCAGCPCLTRQSCLCLPAQYHRRGLGFVQLLQLLVHTFQALDGHLRTLRR